MVLLSPVKLSIALSDISNDEIFDDNILPNTVSVTAGAVENTNTESDVIPNPVDGVALSCGCWNTPLIDSIICDARVTEACVPPSCVILNLVFTPSNATFNVCEDPAPSPVKFICVPLFAVSYTHLTLPTT